MAMMAKMRSLASWFIIGVGGIFVLFMILSDTRVAEIFGGQTNIIGSINGEDITYQEFSEAVERQREQYKAQYGRDLDEEMMDVFHDQVWESLINQKLIGEEVEKYGITVSNEEINDVIYGPNPPDFLRNQFVDSTGNFNRQLYEQALSQQNNEVLLAVEENVRQMRISEKLQSYALANVNISEGEIKRRFTDQNTRVNAAYILVDLSTIPDKDVQVSKEDLRKYYDENLDQYKVDHQRKIKYVIFSKAASQEDSQSVKNNLSAIVKKAKEDTSGFKSYVEIYSEMPYSRDTLIQHQSSSEAIEALSSANPGDVVGPVPAYEGYTVYKLINKVPAKETSVRASHILIPFDGDENKASAKAMEIYNKLAAGADFAQMAKENSTDPGSAKNGGDLGWFGKGRMVKEFENASFNGKIGEIQKPVKTNYGFHIIKVTGKSNSDYVVERIVNRVKPSATTVENAYQNATDFVFVTEKNGFDVEAKGQGYDVIESPAFSEDAPSVPGIGVNKRLVEFTFENDVDDVSDVIKFQGGYIVAKVSEITKPGVKKFEEVEASLKNVVMNEKKFDKAKKIAEQIKNSITGKNMSFEQAASSFSQARLDTTGVFTPNQTVPKIGRDYAFADAALHAKVNSVSEPVKGQRGYYLVKVLSRNDFDKSAYEVQRNTLRDNLLQEKKSNFLNQWIEGLRKDSKIVDNRWKFYR